jgi:hypothetical protein
MWKQRHADVLERVGCAVIEARSGKIKELSDQLMEMQLRMVDLSKQSHILFSSSFRPESLYADVEPKADAATSTSAIPASAKVCK